MIDPSKYLRQLGLLSSLAVIMIVNEGCKGGFGLKPHRSREADMAPAAAEGRFSSVMERASMFEKQNNKSRDVHWYRVWRGTAMIGLGQVNEGEQVIDQVLSDISDPSVTVAQVGRLRMFAYDQKAKAALARKRPDQAIVQLDRALTLASDTPVESGSSCDRDLMLAARHRQIGKLAAATGDGARASKAQRKVARYVEDWSVCLAQSDYPSLHVTTTLTSLFNGDETPVAAAPAARPAPVKPAAPPPAAKPPPPAKKKPEPPPAKLPDGEAPDAAPKLPTPPPVPTGPTTLRSVSVRYAPIDASPWQPHVGAVAKIVSKRFAGSQADAVIRTDGGRRALRIRIKAKDPVPLADLIPVFKGTVIFFENTRDIDPTLTQVLVRTETSAGAQHVLAEKSDILDMFVDRIDAETFMSRLVAPR